MNLLKCGLTVAMILAFGLSESAPVDAHPEPSGLTEPGSRVVERHGGIIEVDVDAPEFSAGWSGIRTWIEIAADSVHSYYGRMPVDRMKLEIVPYGGRGVGGGTAYKHGPRPFIRISLGSETSLDQLTEDWTLTHELVHLFIPQLSRRQTWLDEGIATYVETIGRSKIGNLPEEKVWQWLVENVPHALDKEISGGLDGTRRWASIYWGGALFCLLADIEIRRESGNEKGLRHALGGILQAGIPLQSTVEARDLLRRGDAAIGMDTLSKLYESYSTRPFQVDAGELWRRLGIKVGSGGGLSFDDSAPMADIRRAITRD